MGRMQVLCEAGDIEVVWEPDSAASVKRAKAEWDRLKRDGYEFFEVGDTTKRIIQWSKGLGRVLAVPGTKSPAERKDPAHPRSRAMAGGPNAERVTEPDAYTRELDGLGPAAMRTVFGDVLRRAWTGLVE